MDNVLYNNELQPSRFGAYGFPTGLLEQAAMWAASCVFRSFMRSGPFILSLLWQPCKRRRWW
jgi:hypothetical protein